MFRRVMTIAGIALVALPLAACAANAASGDVPAGSASTPSSTPRVIDLAGSAAAPGPDGEAFVGMWGGPDAPSVDFRADGTVRVDDGCNPYVGTYVVEGGTATITPGIATQRECTDRVKWLSDVRAVTVVDGELSLADELDAQVGTLSRSE